MNFSAGDAVILKKYIFSKKKCKCMWSKKQKTCRLFNICYYRICNIFLDFLLLFWAVMVIFACLSLLLLQLSDQTILHP